jgi:FKBP-type peptidyl-prolyl cis-trans isomerase 2
MTTAKTGDTVKVHYTGKLKNGSVFDTSKNQEPFQFTIGDEIVIPGFEEAVIGLSEGETVTVAVPKEKAYGPRRDELLVNVDRKRLPNGLEPELGQQLEIKRTEGDNVPATVVQVTDDAVTLDANHPLAGHDLLFDIKLVQIA